MKSSTLQTAVLLVASVLISSTAWADPISAVSVTGTVWRVHGNLLDAPTADPVAGTGAGDIIQVLGTFTANSINFLATGSQTLGDFLAFGGANVGGMTAGMGDLMSNCSGSTSVTTCYSTFIRIDGAATFFGGTTYTLRHDDGAVMTVNGNTVISSAPPTSPTDTTWTPGSTVSGPFRIYYAGTNQNPEQLRLTGNVPDGGVTFMLLGGVLVGLETLRRKFRV